MHHFFIKLVRVSHHTWQNVGKQCGIAVVLLVMVWSSTAAVGQHTLRNKPRLPLGNNPNPVIWGGKQARPAQQPPVHKTNQHRHHGRSHHGGHHYSHYGFRSYSPYIGRTYRYGPYYYRSYPYAYSYLYTPAYYYADAGNLFGPQAAQRFLGMGNLAQPANVVPQANAPAPRNALGAEAEAKVERATNAQANALAWRFIGFGDAQFAQRKYLEANDRYRKASRSAPQLADAWFRRAFALSAMGRHAQAIGAVERGLRIDPDWARSDFELQELFGADEAAKNAYLDALAEAAQEDPHDAERLFMWGAALHFDGQTQQAEKCFERSLRLAGGDGEHIRAFLAK